MTPAGAIEVPSSAAATEVVVIATITPAAMALLGVAPGEALQILPVSAGLSGAVVSALKMHLAGAAETARPGGRMRFVTTAGSGAAAAVFSSPAIVTHLGWETVPSSMFVHFVVGLVGSALCDSVLQAGPSVAKWLVEAGKRAIGVTK